MSTGSRYAGTIVIDIPFSPYYENIPDTILFEQRPRLYSNLGMCRHYKVQGTAYRPTNNGPKAAPRYDSVFGQTYDQSGVGVDILSRSTTGTEHYVRVEGNFNNCRHGTWVFGLAAQRAGNKVYVASGAPDLIGDKRYYGGYTPSVYEFRQIDGRIEVRYTSLYDVYNLYRTHEITPSQAISVFKNRLDSQLMDAAWSEWRKVYSAISFDAAGIKIPSWDQVFPSLDRSVRWGELAADAYNSVPFFSSNGIAYASDIVSLKRDLRQTLSLIQSLGTTGKLATKAANLFLSFYYGWRLLVSDTIELQEAYQKRASSRNFWNRATSRRTWEAHDATYMAVFQCYYHRYRNVSSLDQFTLENDLALTPENLWDLVPFSFVVDWFVGIGDILEDFSNYQTFVQAHEIICTGRSIKATKRISADKLKHGLAGEITFSYYHRDYTSKVFSPTFHFSNSVNPLDHMIEGTALIVSRR